MKLKVFDQRNLIPGSETKLELQRNGEVLGIAIHHSGTADRNTGKGVGTAQSIFEYHVLGLGWDRGGYNYVITPTGKVEYALDESIPAYHAGFRDPEDKLELENGQYWNNHFLAICVSGWFENDRTDLDSVGNKIQIPNRWTAPSTDQLKNLVPLIQFLRDKYQIPPEMVLGHSELNGQETRCPGANFDIQKLRQELAAIDRDPDSPYHSDKIKVINHSGRTVVAGLPVKGLISDGNKTRIKSFLDRTLRLLVQVGLVSGIPVLGYLWTLELHLVLGIVRIILTLAWLPVLPAFSLRWINPWKTAFMWIIQRELEKNGANPEISSPWVPISEIAPVMRLAAVAFEDPKFPYHAGFAWGHIFRVWRENRAGKPRRGASTISQQLVKNLFLWPGQAWVRKGLEAYLTLILEAVLPKRRILEIYLNIIQMDLNVFGVEANTPPVISFWSPPVSSQMARWWDETAKPPPLH